MRESKFLFVGSLGFPFGSAAVYRRTQVAHLVQKTNGKVCLLLSRGIHSKEIVRKNGIKVRGSFQGIRYFHCSLLAYRPSNFIIRNFLKVFGGILELITILFLRIMGYERLMVYTNHLATLKYYWFIRSIFCMHLTYDYVEYLDSIPLRNEKNIENLPKKFDDVFFKCTDDVLAISNFLKNQVLKKDPTKPIFLLPPTFDASSIREAEIDVSYKYLAYCGSIGYIHAIHFILDAFQASAYKEYGIKLILIINGQADKLNQLNTEIVGRKMEDDVVLKSELSYNTLIAYYKNAYALLLPLQDRVQDRARFPFKLSEYAYAGRPILTNNVGVVNEVFVHMKNAIISPAEDLGQFIYYLNFLFENEKIAKDIGRESYRIYETFFDIRNYNLDEFIHGR